MDVEFKTEIGYLFEVYNEDSLISDDLVMNLLKSKFPKSRATMKTIALWKNYFRKQGLMIPMKRRA